MNVFFEWRISPHCPWQKCPHILGLFILCLGDQRHEEKEMSWPFCRRQCGFHWRFFFKCFLGFLIFPKYYLTTRNVIHKAFRLPFKPYSWQNGEFWNSCLGARPQLSFTRLIKALWFHPLPQRSVEHPCDLKFNECLFWNPFELTWMLFIWLCNGMFNTDLRDWQSMSNIHCHGFIFNDTQVSQNSNHFNQCKYICSRIHMLELANSNRNNDWSFSRCFSLFRLSCLHFWTWEIWQTRTRSCTQIHSNKETEIDLWTPLFFLCYANQYCSLLSIHKILSFELILRVLELRLLTEHPSCRSQRNQMSSSIVRSRYICICIYLYIYKFIYFIVSVI